MVARPSWKAHLRLSLVSIPVAGYTAHETAQDVPLHQIHKTCHSRIRYKKTCPIHREVPKDEIVSGYEFAKDQYVEIDPEELDKLRSQSDKAISIDAFVSPDAVDPAYFSGQTYYLLPDGPAGNKPYLLLHQGMVEQKKCAIARVVFRHREQLVLLRPRSRLIVMELLLFAAEVKQADAFAEGTAPS